MSAPRLRRKLSISIALVVALAGVVAFAVSRRGCSCRHVEEQTSSFSPFKDDDDDEEGEENEAKEEAEKAELMKPQFWRVKIVIAGQGFVTSYDKTVTCGNDGTHHGEMCGPTAFNAPITGYKPAVSALTAIPAPGWRLSKWDAVIQHANGKVTKRKKTSIRDFYINRFKRPYDANDLEVVTVTFKEIPDGESVAPPASSAPMPSSSAR